MRRYIDFKFVACVLVGLVALGVGVHFLHAFQLSRSQTLLLKQAERAESEEDPAKADYRKAAHHLQRYLGYRPDDTDALTRLGTVLDKAAKQSNSERDKAAAYKVLDQVVRRDPGRSETRRRAAELAMHFGEYAHAKNLLEPLVDQARTEKRKDGGLWLMEGICEVAAKNYKAAEDWLILSKKQAPNNLESYVKLAALYQLHGKELGHDSTRAADAVVDEMVENNPKSQRALLNQALYYKQFHGQEKEYVERTQKALNAAAKLGTQDADALVLGAALARDRGDLKEARRLLQSGLDAKLKSVGLYLSLMALEIHENNKDAAKDVLDRGMQDLPKEWRLRAALAELALQDGNLKEAERAVKELQKVGLAGPVRTAHDLLAAQILMLQSKWGDAVALLDKLRLTRGAASPEHDLELLLGRCHERLGNPDKALAAYRRAIELKPLDSPARFRVNAVLLNLGRHDEAVAGYREALRFKDAPPRLRLDLVRALIARDMRLPEKKRALAEVKAELDRSAKDLPGDPEITILRAELQLLEDPGHPEHTREALVKARDASPDKLDLWLALAELAGRDRPAEALQILDDAGRRPAFQDRIELRLARLRLAAALPKKEEARAALAREETAARKTKDAADRQRLLAALGNSYLRLGEKQEAERQWQELAKEQPTNLALHLVLLDLALELRADEREIDEELTKIRKIEGGTGGPFWHFGEAARLFRRAVPKDKQDLPPNKEVAKDALLRARRHLAEAAKLRPSWSRPPALLAEIDTFEGRKEEALNNYRQAVRLGDRRPAVLRQYMRSLADARLFAEDKQLISQIADQQEQNLLDADLGKAAASMLFTAEGPGSALALARKAVPSNSKDYRDYLWLGQLITAAGAKGADPGWKQEAEQAFTRARDLKPKEAVTWLALYNFLRETEQKQKADAVLAQSQKTLEKADAATVLAMAREMAGDREGAEKQFLAAVQARQVGALELQNLAMFYLRHSQVARAEPYLQRLLSPLSTTDKAAAEGRAPWVRRSLALAYAAHGNYQDFKKALGILDENKKAPGETDDDRRARAAILAMWAEHRKEAIELLKQLGSRQPLTEEEKWLLGRLYDADESWGQAQSTLLGLLNAPGTKNPAYYAYYVDRLLTRKKTDQAVPWLDKLEQVAPQALATKTLRARFLAASRKDAAAVALLREYATAHDKELDQVAAALESAAAAAPNAAPPDKNVYYRYAEELYRDLLKKSDTAVNRLKYAVFLGRRERVREALNECARAREQGMPDEAATAAVAVLRTGRPGDADCQRVIGWLREGAEKGKNPPAYLTLLAEVSDLRGEFRQAIDYNLEALRRSPDNVVVLNNLAWLLAFQHGKNGKGDEALRLINRAIDLAGPLPALRDTRGTVLLESHKTRQAIPELQQAATLRPTPGGYFRLARALWAENNKEAARTAFQQAVTLGLRAESLHPLERDVYQELRPKFAQ
jgi:tetratricopeptide (TPR) repeat protein